MNLSYIPLYFFLNSPPSQTKLNKKTDGMSKNVRLQDSRGNCVYLCVRKRGWGEGEGLNLIGIKGHELF